MDREPTASSPRPLYPMIGAGMFTTLKRCAKAVCCLLVWPRARRVLRVSTRRHRTATRTSSRWCHWPALVLLIFLVFKDTACADCEDQCSDYFAITFDKATPWASGTYDVDLKFDGDSVHCTFHVPASSDPQEPSCDGGDTLTVVNSQYMGHYGTPKQIEIAISLEGVSIISTTVAPEYKDTEGWDRSCGPPCQEGGTSLSIP